MGYLVEDDSVNWDKRSRESVKEKDTGLSSRLSLSCLDDVRER